jgi:hypothetical protein
MAKNLRLTDTVTIALSGLTSTTLTLEGGRIPLAVLIPAAMTGTSMTFLASNDNATFRQIFLESTAYAVTIPTGTIRHIALNRQAFEGVRFLQLVVNGAGEAAVRTIGVISGE